MSSSDHFWSSFTFVATAIPCTVAGMALGNTLEVHAFPKIGKRSVAQINAGDIRETLLPIWTATPETARRVKQRINATLDFSISKGWRSDPNPCGAVVKGLPPQKGGRGHFAALPHSEMPAFLAAVRASSSRPLVKLAFEFLILTAARSGEVRGATWQEIAGLDGSSPSGRSRRNG